MIGCNDRWVDVWGRIMCRFTNERRKKKRYITCIFSRTFASTKHKIHLDLAKINFLVPWLPAQTVNVADRVTGIGLAFSLLCIVSSNFFNSAKWGSQPNLRKFLRSPSQFRLSQMRWKATCGTHSHTTVSYWSSTASYDTRMALIIKWGLVYDYPTANTMSPLLWLLPQYCWPDPGAAAGARAGW